MEKEINKNYIATYIQSETSTGLIGHIEAVLLKDEDNNTLFGKTFSEMYSLCYDDAEEFVMNSRKADEFGYLIVGTESGLDIVDKNDHIICTYNIHQL